MSEVVAVSQAIARGYPRAVQQLSDSTHRSRGQDLGRISHVDTVAYGVKK